MTIKRTRVAAIGVAVVAAATATTIITRTISRRAPETTPGNDVATTGVRTDATAELRAARPTRKDTPLSIALRELGGSARGRRDLISSRTPAAATQPSSGPAGASKADPADLLAVLTRVALGAGRRPDIDVNTLARRREEIMRRHAASLLVRRDYESAAAQYARLLGGDDLKTALADLKAMWKAIHGMQPEADTEVRLLVLRGFLKRPLPGDVRQLGDVFVAYAYFLDNEHGKSLHELEQLEAKVTVPRLQDQIRLLRASNYIKQGKTREAVVELKVVRDDGRDDEQRAKGGFLIGWIRLLDGEREGARRCFEDTYKRWPETPFGQRAAKLLQDLNR